MGLTEVICSRYTRTIFLQNYFLQFLLLPTCVNLLTLSWPMSFTWQLEANNVIYFIRSIIEVNLAKIFFLLQILAALHKISLSNFVSLPQLHLIGIWLAQIFLIVQKMPSHKLKMMHIPAMVYFINVHDSQRSGRGMGGPTTLKVGEALYKICSLCTIFEKKFIRYVLWNALNFSYFFV